MNNRQKLLGDTIRFLAISYQHLTGRFNRELEPLKLNMTQMSVLTHFSRDPRRRETVTQLAKLMNMNQPALTKACKSLTDNGWMTKAKDEQDARITHLCITEAGLTQLALAQKTCLPILEDAFEGLADGQLQQLIELLAEPAQRLTTTEKE